MPQVVASRANTLDGILDELPDFSDGYFSYPVDDFFPAYIEQLGQRQAQDVATDNTGNGGYTNFGDPVQNGNSLSAFRNGSQGPTVMSMEMDNYNMAEPAVVLPAKHVPNGSSIQYPDAMMQMPFIGSVPQNGLEQIHSEGSGSQVGAEDGTRSSKSRAKKVSKENSDYQGDSDGMESDEAEPGRKGSKPSSKAKRNAKQQAQNKQAQQRYRERRKQRFNDMEHAIDDLNLKLQQMSAIQNQNALLVAKSHELETLIAARDKEIDNLRGQVQEGNEGEESSEKRRQADEALVHDMQGQAAQNVQAMKEFIEQHSLRNVNPTGEGVDPVIIQQMAEMIGRQCGPIQSNLRADGVKVLRLMSADMSQLSRIKCIRKVECVSRGLQDLKLTDLQKGQILLLRTNHLNNLKEVYVERHALNLQAMAFMLPQANSQIGQTLESKLERMRHASFRRIAAQTVGLDEILTLIKDNLRREQKRVSEMNFVTLHRILSPIQAALYVTAIFPMSFDALELANILAQDTESSRSGQSSADLAHNNNNNNNTETDKSPSSINHPTEEHSSFTDKSSM